MGGVKKHGCSICQVITSLQEDILNKFRSGLLHAVIFAVTGARQSKLCQKKKGKAEEGIQKTP